MSSFVFFGQGSSPRVRGAARHEPLAMRITGIIPACAGSRLLAGGAGMGMWDHPRVCGEQDKPPCDTWIDMGSSPRVRGAAIPADVLGTASGIIPACAGSSYRYAGVPLCGGDHPRVCGEQKRYSMVARLVMGSSPRVRGAEPVPLRRGCFSRIIPACAGSRNIYKMNQKAYWDHPRVCGEQPSAPHEPTDMPGSSPRVRGAAALGVDLGRLAGIIPACAGSSLTS